MLITDYQRFAHMRHFFALMGQRFVGMRQCFVEMRHCSFPVNVILYRKSVKINSVKLWVYIYEDKNGDLKISLSVTDNILIFDLLQNVRIVYLRPFEIPFDAIAHKHLLTSLSKKSVLFWIDKHKQETKIWLSTLTK